MVLRLLSRKFEANTFAICAHEKFIFGAVFAVSTALFCFHTYKTVSRYMDHEVSQTVTIMLNDSLPMPVVVLSLDSYRNANAVQLNIPHVEMHFQRPTLDGKDIPDWAYYCISSIIFSQQNDPLFDKKEHQKISFLGLEYGTTHWSMRNRCHALFLRMTFAIQFKVYNGSQNNSSLVLCFHWVILRARIETCCWQNSSYDSPILLSNNSRPSAILILVSLEIITRISYLGKYCMWIGIFCMLMLWKNRVCITWA